MKGLATILGIAVIIGGIYAVRTGFRSVITEVTTDHASKCLSLAGHTAVTEDGHTYIEGSIRNNCDRKFGSVTVTFLLDRPRGPLEDLPKAAIYAYIRDVAARETKKFKSAFPISSDSIYRFDAISGF